MIRYTYLATATALIGVGCSSPKNYYYNGEVLQTVEDMQTGSAQDITQDYNSWDGCEQYFNCHGVTGRMCTDKVGATIAIQQESTFTLNSTSAILRAMDAVAKELEALGYPVKDKKVRIISEMVAYAIIYSEPGAYDALVATIGVEKESSK